MAKGLYLGIDSKARRMKKAYIGIDGKARKVKKMYLGVDGKARLCYSAGELRYYGAATDLNNACVYPSATTIGNYALFGGGDHQTSCVSGMNAYNASLTRTLPTDLSIARKYLTATTIGNYALFGGGQWRTRDDGDTIYPSSDVLDAYNGTLTRTTPTGLSASRHYLAATTVGNYALFGGGKVYDRYGQDRPVSSSVDTYNTSLTRTTPTVLSTARGWLAATTVGNYALFGGGANGTADRYDSYYATVDAYSTSLTRTTPTSLRVGRAYLAATTVGKYALFGGGRIIETNVTITYYSYVDAYDSSLTRTAPTNLSTSRSDLSATTVNGYALFSTSYNESFHVDIYDESLTRTISTDRGEEIAGRGATTIGNYALFGGGMDYSSTPMHKNGGYPTTNVTVYTVD